MQNYIAKLYSKLYCKIVMQNYIAKLYSKLYCKILLQNCIAKFYCKIILQNCIAKLYCKILLQNYIAKCVAKLYCKIVLQNFIAKLYCKIVLQNFIAKLYCKICCKIILQNCIVKFPRNCLIHTTCLLRTKFIIGFNASTCFCCKLQPSSGSYKCWRHWGQLSTSDISSAAIWTECCITRCLDITLHLYCIVLYCNNTVYWRND
jgi:hypothetical protein